MKSIAFTSVTCLGIAALITGGYFAVQGLKDPSDYIPIHNQTVGDLRNVQTEPETNSPEVPSITEPSAHNAQVVTKPVEISLATNLQKLIDSKTVLKIGSKGPSVGYVQEFMNKYFKKTLKVDNDFGKTLETNVKAFQKAVGLPQTGQVGTQGLTKMVDWLKKNP